MKNKITFEVSPFDENSDERAFVVHKITAFLDGEEAGYIKLSYIDGKKWKEIMKGNPWIFRRKMKGHHDIPKELLDAPIDKIIQAYSESHPWGNPECQVKYMLEKAESDMTWYERYYVNKPIVDFIQVHKSFRRMGFATKLHKYAIIFLKNEFGLKLYKSTCITPEGEPFYKSEKIRTDLPLRSEKPLCPKRKKTPYNHYLNVKREYFLRTQKIRDEYEFMY